MTSHGVSSPTTDTHKGNEIRVPKNLIVRSYQTKKVKELQTLTVLKSLGSRVRFKTICKILGIHCKTGKRIIARLIKLQWVGCDGTYIFPRAWSRIGYKRKGGLYLIRLSKYLKEFLFTFALKEITKRMARAQKKRSATPKGLPVRYYTKSLGISERTYFRNVRASIKLGLMRTKKVFTKIGRKEEYKSLRKNLHGVPLFVKGKFVVVPEPSEIKFFI